ncbi:MAG TPA: 3-oxoadipyl-CoA thiolase [Elusimicrobia bacterium]|nr:3-oxoadipyl-CoA thiolase [Elusimicrobiota bacterium]
MSRRKAAVVAAIRTPAGKYGGALARVRPDDLAAQVLKAVLARVPQVEPAAVDDVILGCANGAGEDNRNIARMAALLAGWPDSVPGVTVNRLCASGLEAVNLAARAIVAGEGEVFVAGGVESMSRAPWVLAKPESGFPYGNQTAYDSALGWRFPNPKLKERFPLENMGETAENIAGKLGVPRAEQDAFALRSHQLAVAARADFAAEIVPVRVQPAKAKAPEALVDQDEPPRPDASLEALAKLKPAFREGGSVTAGNSSTLNDGAAALLLMEAGRAEKLGLKPIAFWLGSASAGVDPRLMGLGPVASTRKLFSRLGVKADGVGLYEINEAFAVQAIACARELGIPLDKLNVRGGGIALGHPLGCSGARIATTLVHELGRRGGGLGLASLCVGVGQGVSTLFEVP